MCTLITASVAACCLFVLANTCNAQTANINRVSGNGNTVVNSTGPGTSGLRQVIRTIGGVDQVVLVASTPVTFAPAGGVQTAAPSFGGRSPSLNLNINAINGNGNRVVNSTSGGRGGANLNINAINGNGNRVLNGTTGGRGGANVNINAINGNRNTVVNRSRP